MQSAALQQILDSPLTGLFISLVIAGIAVAGRLSVTVSQGLFFAAWLIAVFGLRQLPGPLCVAGSLISGGLLLGLAWWARPDIIPEYSGLLTAKTESIFPVADDGHTRMEFGDSGAVFHFAPGIPQEQKFIMQAVGDSLLSVSKKNGKISVSAKILDKQGTIIAELIDNQWKIAPPPKTWDRNYNDNALEVKNDRGRIVLQVQLRPDRVRLLSEWWHAGGRGIRFVSLGPDKGFMVVQLTALSDPDTPRIEPIFLYPSDSNLGHMK
jgi:hypothetical protein